MPFKEGENVRKGARLVGLDSAELRAIVASSDAQAKLDQTVIRAPVLGVPLCSCPAAAVSHR